MLRQAGWIWTTVLALGFGSCGSAALASDELDIFQARQLLVELINRDRKSQGLEPVKADLAATSAAQGHSDEMSRYAFLSHYNLTGKYTDQRYSETQGGFVVLENVTLTSEALKGTTWSPQPLVSAPKFSRAEIEGIEARYINQKPPHDGHRRNILTPSVTHVGLGLSKAGAGKTLTVANCMVLVSKQLQSVDPIPLESTVGNQILVSGRTLPGCMVKCVTVTRLPLPKVSTRAELMQYVPFVWPEPAAAYWPRPYQSPAPIEATSDGKFQVPVRLSDNGNPGVYVVSIWITHSTFGDLVASRRTVIVK